MAQAWSISGVGGGKLMIPQLYDSKQIAERLNCTIAEVEVRWRRGDLERYNIGSLRRYAIVERPAAELNGASGLRRSGSGSTGQGRDRREYMRNYQREYLRRRRAQFFAGKTCHDCGQAEGLEIHHRDPGLKVSHKVWSWSSERREAELAKCDVVCNACHKKRHGVTPGGRHGGQHRYNNGCRCDPCVQGQRERDRRKPSRRRRVYHSKENR